MLVAACTTAPTAAPTELADASSTFVDAITGTEVFPADVPLGDVMTVVVFRVPDNTPPGAEVFLAGTVNGWASADPRARLERSAAGALAVRLGGLAPGQRVEFKFTRGSWATVERADRGGDVSNRVAVFDPVHPVVALFVERWADLPAPASTRSGDVRVLRDVVVPQLGSTRNVWVYLPPGYASASERYPVTYMFDGQNLFDARASAFGSEWQIDEALEALHYEGRLPGIIVVGVENSAARGCEYNVFASDPHPACGDRSALGDRTVGFLVETLKPHIDRDFRTRPGRADTAVAGSSMGGSMAVRAGFSHPDIFSRVAALSPSYQNTLAATPAMPAYVRAQRLSLPFRLHQDVGTAEHIRELGPDVITRNMLAVRDAARAAGLVGDAQRALLVEGATHDEGAWSARIREVLGWLWSP